MSLINGLIYLLPFLYLQGDDKDFFKFRVGSQEVRGYFSIQI